MTYRIESIVHSDNWPAAIGTVGECFTYIITDGGCKIVGYRVGSLHEVTSYVESYVRQLNVRLHVYKKSLGLRLNYKPCFARDILSRL
ncbi:MAG: hypothetical protein AB1810_09580 [Pseudomonadota bacterium]